jgi:hypothetical protein
VPVVDERAFDRELALRRAERARVHHEARRRLYAGLRHLEVDYYALLAGELGPWEPFIATARLDKLLMAIRGIGEARMEAILDELRLPRRRTIGELSYGDRRQLADLVRFELEADPIIAPPPEIIPPPFSDDEEDDAA